MGKQIAVVTGGAGGIGSAVVERLLRRGDDVLAVDLDAETSNPGIASGDRRGERVAISADVTDPAAAEAVRERALERFGRIDILVNTAGGAGPSRVRNIEQIELAVWDLVMDINLRSTFLMTRAVVPVMRERNHGRIVNFSSVTAAGETGPLTTVTARLPYATAKAALVGFTSQLAKDVGAYGITVNALMPGLIVGPVGTRIRDKFEGLPEATRETMRERWPMGRPGSPDEVAAAVEFLCSEGASYISGVTLPVDGAFL